MTKTLLVTGGAGFIGSAVIHEALAQTDWQIVNVDKLTYSGNLDSLKDIADNPRYSFIQADIASPQQMQEIFAAHKPDAVMHLAAESHVDRSIDSPEAFINTNIRGTFVLLEAAREWWKKLCADKPEAGKSFRFLHISTDEVFGDLAHCGKDQKFNEQTAYAPSSPYSASKAASDHLARAWQRTYGLPVIVTNCSNNYGPRQFPEKLIPVTILNALVGKPLPVYGNGLQIRDWLYVEDHARALLKVLKDGVPGQTYAIGGNNERRNIEIVRAVCQALEELAPAKPANVKNYEDLIVFVTDRPGHDERYAIDATKITRELDWRPEKSFQDGIRSTVTWYLDNRKWWQRILDGSYRMERLGTKI